MNGSQSRIKNAYTLFDRETDIGEHHHQWRTVECDGDTDTVECSRCGRQTTMRCSFDEDFA